MRSTTRIVLGVNNVGDANDAPEIIQGTFSESIIKLAEWLSPRSMAQRFDLVIARSEEEARNALRIRGRGKSDSSGLQDQTFVNTLVGLMEGGVDADES